MIVKVMGLLDLITAGVFLLLHYNFILPGACAFFIVYLGAKTIGFWGDIASVLDGLCVVYMLLMFIGLRSVLTFVIAAYLSQKALFSLMA